jgi:hypothetical protein
MARFLVSSHEAAVREFPMEKRVATTRELRATRAPSGR